MQAKQRAKAEAPEAPQKSGEADRPVWFLGRELQDKPKDKPATEKTDAKTPAAAAKSAKKAQPAAKAPAEPPTEERRPSQLEAYMRYAKMRQPQADDTLAPVRTRQFPASQTRAASNENDSGWDGEMPRPRRARPAPVGFRLRDAILAGVASIAIGALGGAVVYDRANDGELSQATFDSIGGFLTGLDANTDSIPATADASNAGPLTQTQVPVANSASAAAFKKPVTTARLDVADAKGQVNAPIPLSISAEPALPDQDIALKLTGLPADAYLSRGTKLPDNAWLLKPAEAAGVKLTLPSAPASPLLIAVDAIEPRTGDLAAPTEEIKIALDNTQGPAAPVTPQASADIQPASAPPDDVKRNFNLRPSTQHEDAGAQPIPAPLENPDKSGVADSTTLMRNGDKLLDIGDFAAARAFFSRARDLGDHEASLRLGQTYDPVVFRERNVQGLKPDPTMALKYYLEAKTAGIEDADTAIDGLQTWMKQ